MINKKIIRIISIPSIIILIDQITKLLINILVKNSIVIIPRILEIEIVKNTGIAFGINNGNLRNILITIVVLILIINFIKTQFKLIDNKTMFSLLLIIGGGIGNLIDRIIRGGVLDFIKISTFPIFNFADIAIVIGWILLIKCIIKFTLYENEEKE